MAVTQLRVLGGAMARVPDEATAFAHRRRGIMVNVAAMYERPEERPDARSLGRRPCGGARAGDDRARTSTSSATRARRGSARPIPGPTWERLAKIKGRYDPTNVFRLNQNIPPEVDSTG